MTNEEFIKNTTHFLLIKNEPLNITKTHGNITISCRIVISNNLCYKEITYCSYNTLVAVYRSLNKTDMFSISRNAELRITPIYYSRTTQNHLRCILRVILPYANYRYIILKHKYKNIKYPELDPEVGFYVIFNNIKLIK